MEYHSLIITRWKRWLLIGIAAIGGLAEAANFTPQRSHLVFPTRMATVFATGFSSSSQHSDLVVDRLGNAHIVKTLDLGHMGNLQYRRWDPAVTNWGGAVVTFGSGDGTWDARYAHLAIDDADRIHLLYQFRISPDPWQWYHRWCTNASGATPLNLAHWTPATPVATITTAGLHGSLIGVGSNLLLFARGGADRNGDTFNDIWIDTAEWDGSAWSWSYLDVAVTNWPGYTQYGGLHSPRLTLSQDGYLHLHYRDDSRNGQRSVAHTRSATPANPIESSWEPFVRHVNIDLPDYRETQGGTGVTDDGTSVALVWAFPNRDGTTPNRNFTRVREPDGGWGAWSQSFSWATRGMPGSYGGPYVSMASDGRGGLFAGYSQRFISHWDPASREWMDVFTNVVASVDAISSLGVYYRDYIVHQPAEYRKPSYVYYYKNGASSLYVGAYLPRRPTFGSLVVLH